MAAEDGQGLFERIDEEIEAMLPDGDEPVALDLYRKAAFRAMDEVLRQYRSPIDVLMENPELATEVVFDKIWQAIKSDIMDVCERKAVEGYVGRYARNHDAEVAKVAAAIADAIEELSHRSPAFGASAARQLAEASGGARPSARGMIEVGNAVCTMMRELKLPGEKDLGMALRPLALALQRGLAEKMRDDWARAYPPAATNQPKGM